MKRKEVKIKRKNKCWEVISHCLSRDGYPRIKFKGKTIEIYRLVYECCYGKIRKGKEVMHICDNRKCINPKHLKLGSHKENMADMKLKKRAKNRYTK